MSKTSSDVGRMKVYQINDWEWIAAPSLEEGLAWYLKDTGLTADEAFDFHFDPNALSDEAMDKMRYFDNEGELGEIGEAYSFREALDKMMAQRADESPFSFAGTEW